MVLDKSFRCFIGLADFLIIFIWLCGLCWLFSHLSYLRAWKGRIHFDLLPIFNQIWYFRPLLALFDLTPEATGIWRWYARAYVWLTGLRRKVDVHWTPLRDWLFLAVMVINAVTLPKVSALHQLLIKLYIVFLVWSAVESLTVWYNTLRDTAILLTSAGYLTQLAVVTLWYIRLDVTLSFFQQWRRRLLFKLVP